MIRKTDLLFPFWNTPFQHNPSVRSIASPDNPALPIQQAVGEPYEGATSVYPHQVYVISESAIFYLAIKCDNYSQPKIQDI